MNGEERHGEVVAPQTDRGRLALDAIIDRYERPLTTVKSLSDEMTVDEFFRFGAFEVLQSLRAREQSARRKRAFHRRTQELRQAARHWTRVWRDGYAAEEPTLRYIAQHQAVLRAYVDGLAVLPGLSDQTRRNSIERLNAVLRLAGPPEPGIRTFEHAFGLLGSRLRAPAEIVVPERIPIAYTDAELRVVFLWTDKANAHKITRPSIPGIPAWRFWRAYFGVLYYVGLRPAEAARIRWSEIHDGRLESDGLNLKQSQTISKVLHPALGEDLEAIRTTRTWVFRWFARGRYVCEQSVNDLAREVLAGCGISAERRLACKGLYGFRKKHYTDCERVTPGAGRKSLRHSSDEIGRQSYEDARQVDGVLSQLPRLWVAGAREALA